MTVYHSRVDLRPVLVRRLLVGLVLVVLAFLVDRQAFAALRTVLFYDTDRSGELREALLAAKFLASGLGVFLVGLVVGTLDRRGWRRAGVLWLVVVVAAAFGGLLKVTVGRERPSHEDQVVGSERMVFRGPGGWRDPYYRSFPSGHTVNAFAAATCLTAFYPPARVVFYSVAAACGVNRVVKHQHFLSDTVAGALIGHLLALWLLACPALRRRWREEPVDSPGGSP